MSIYKLLCYVKRVVYNKKFDIRGFREVIMEKDKYLSKEEFLKGVARRARFTISDVNIIWCEIEKSIKEMIKNEEKLAIPGLFRMSVTTIGEHNGWNAVKNEKLIVPESKRVVFKASRTLLSLFNEDEET